MKMVLFNKPTIAAVLLLVVGRLASSNNIPANIRVRPAGLAKELPTNIQLIAVGGITELELTTTPDVDVISLSNNGHTKAAALPTTGLASFGRTAINNTLYIVAGAPKDEFFTNAFVSFSPSANSWTSLPDFPVNVGENAVVAVDNVIYSFGGISKHDGLNPHVHFNYAYKYDTTGQVWLGIENPLPLMNVDVSCAVAYKSDIYLLFGTGDLFRSSDGSNWSKKASLAHVRFGLSCVALNSGKILVAGGWDHHDYVNLVDIYDVTKDSWSAAPSMVENRAWADAVVISTDNHDDAVIVCGGTDPFNAGDLEPVYDSCELFSQKSNQWNKTQFSLDKPRYAYGLFAIQIKQ